MTPTRHMQRYGTAHPGVYDLCARMRQTRGSSPALDVWPDWCWLPPGAVAAVLRHQSGGSDPFPLDVSTGTALAAWRATQGIYRFDPAVYYALIDTAPEKIPVEIFYHIPEWCVWIDTPGRTENNQPSAGFFAHLDAAQSRPHPELRILTSLDDMEFLLVEPIQLEPGLTIDQLWEKSYDDTIERARKNDSLRPLLEMMGQLSGGDPMAMLTGENIVRGLREKLSLLLYLCTENAEIRPETGTETPGKTERFVTVRKTGRIFYGPKKPRIWETAWNIGTQIRAYKIRADMEDERTVRPHIRRAHWHHYWTGPRSTPETRKLICRWIPPTPVGTNQPDPHIHRVKKKN